MKNTHFTLNHLFDLSTVSICCCKCIFFPLPQFVNNEVEAMAIDQAITNSNAPMKRALNLVILTGLQELLTKGIQIEESPVKTMEALEIAGLQKPGLEQNKKMKLVMFKNMKIIFVECFLSEPATEASKRTPPCTKHLGKGLCKVWSEEVARNMLPSIISNTNMHRKSWIATFSNQQHWVSMINRNDLVG